MKIIRQIPNLMTLGNLSLGTLGCINAFVGDYTNTILFILLAGILDFLDGFVARLVKSDGEFGKQLDSLADMVTFGVLPGIYLFQLSRSLGIMEWAGYFSLLIPVFSAIRLADFNIKEQSVNFSGLPTPANAIMICTLAQIPILDLGSELALLSVIFASCFLLVSPFTMLGLKFKTFRFRGNEYRYMLIVVSIGLFVGLGIQALPLIIPLYILLSLVAILTSKNSISAS